MYCTAVGQWYYKLNGVCYIELYAEVIAQQVDRFIAGWMDCYIQLYVEGTAKHVDSVIAGWMECVIVKFMWNLLHSRWTVVLQIEWSVLP